MKTFNQFLSENLDESFTSKLFKAARLSADARSVARSIATGDVSPVVRRLLNKLIGRKIISKAIFK